MLDGTWQQAKQIYATNKPVLDALCTQVSFPATPRPATQNDGSADGLPSGAAAEGGALTSSFIRQQPQEHFLSTLESIALALRTLEGERGPAVFAALLRVFDEMNQKQRLFYTETKAFAPRDKARRAQRDTAAVATATLTEPVEQPAGTKPRLFVLCRPERGLDDTCVLRPVGRAVLCTFDEAQRQCGRLNSAHGRPRGKRFCVRAAADVREEGLPPT